MQNKVINESQKHRHGFACLFYLGFLCASGKVVPTETAIPTSTFTPAPTATITATLIPLISKEQFTNGYFEIIQPSQALIEKGLETGVIRQEIDVHKLVYDVHNSKNHPNQKIVFGRNPETHEIILATRVNPNTSEMSWYVAGLRDLADVVGMTMGTQLYSPNNELFSHSDVQKINALVVQE